MSRTRSIQLAEQFGEVAVARLGCRRLEGPAECGGDTGMGGRNVHANDSSIHVQFCGRKLFAFCVHMGETMARGVSFVRFDMGIAKTRP